MIPPNGCWVKPRACWDQHHDFLTESTFIRNTGVNEVLDRTVRLRHIMRPETAVWPLSPPGMGLTNSQDCSSNKAGLCRRRLHAERIHTIWFDERFISKPEYRIPRRY